jgi:diacylglycerol kinase (ATP)
MIFSHSSFDPNKIEVFQTSQILINTKRKVHFQIDGEYLGKLNEIQVNIIPNALTIMVPFE